MKIEDISEWWDQKHEAQAIENLTNSSFDSTFKCLRINDKFKKGDVILEIGVGTGKCTKEMVDRGLKVAACDISSVALDNVKNFVTEVFSTPEEYPTEKYDLVVLFNVAQHMANETLKKQIEHILRSLKVNGFCAMQLIDGEADDRNVSVIDSPIYCVMGGVIRKPKYVTDLIESARGKVLYLSELVNCAAPSRVKSYVIHFSKGV